MGLDGSCAKKGYDAMVGVDEEADGINKELEKVESFCVRARRDPSTLAEDVIAFRSRTLRRGDTKRCEEGFSSRYSLMTKRLLCRANLEMNRQSSSKSNKEQGSLLLKGQQQQQQR